MCCLALIPAGKRLPENALAHMHSHNSDGWGYAFINEFNVLVIRKGYFKLKKLSRAFEADHAQYGGVSPFLIHARWSTHGSNNKANCHPFAICGGEACLGHNGVLSDFLPPHNKNLSDTRWFCHTVMDYRAVEHVVDENFNKILAKMIGKANKFVILSKDRKYSIVNEDSGLWDDDSGVWFSNSDYARPYASHSYTSSTERNCCFPGAIPATAVKMVDGSQSFIARHGDIVTYDSGKRSLPAAYQQDEIPWDGDVDVQNMDQSEFERMLNTMSGDEIIDNIEFDELTEEQWKQVSAKLEIEAMDKKFEESLL